MRRGAPEIAPIPLISASVITDYRPTPAEPRAYAERAKLIFAEDFRNSLVFHLDPESVSTAGKVEWDQTPTGDNKLPLVEYKGSAAGVISIRLLFNDVAHPHPTQKTTARSLAWLKRAMQPDEQTGEPPTLLFNWGSRRPIERVVIDSMEVEEILIDPATGSPLRAFVDLTLLRTPARRVEEDVTRAERPRRPIPPPIRGKVQRLIAAGE